MPGNWGHQITLQRSIIKVKMHENTSKERNQFPLLIMEISSNLGSKRNYKSGYEIKEKQNKICKWLILYSVGQSLLCHNGEAQQCTHDRVVTKPVVPSCIKLTTSSSTSSPGLPVGLWISGSHIPPGRKNKSCWRTRIWWQRGSCSCLVCAQAEELRCDGSVVGWHYWQHWPGDWLARMERTEEWSAGAQGGPKKEHWGYMVVHWPVWLKI